MAKINDYIAHRLLFYFSPGIYRKFWKNKLGVFPENLIPSARKIEKEIALLPLFLNSESIFFDIGANMGLYLFWAEDLGVKKAVGFEPIPFLHEKLNRIFPQYTIENLAVSNQEGMAILRIPKINKKRIETRATLLGKEQTDEFNECVEIKIPSIRLDNYCEKNNIYPDFIKVDIEGAEEMMLNGCSELLQNKRPILMIEIEKRHNRNMEHTLQLITKHGYGCFHFSPSTYEMVEYTEINELQETKNEGTMAYINNFIFIPKEKVSLIEDLKKVRII